MLSIPGDRISGFCDGLSRRNFLRIGSLGLGGLSLADLLRAEAAAGKTERQKSIVMIYLPGGPTQHETFDPKPDAAREIRGSYRPISTKIPGVQYCELLPKLSAMADSFSVVRSLVGIALPVMSLRSNVVVAGKTMSACRAVAVQAISLTIIVSGRRHPSINRLMFCW